MVRSCLIKSVTLAIALSTSTAMAGMVSTMENVNAVMESQGFYLAPVSEIYVAGDESPARVYEIVRPMNERISIGRLNTSCSCIQVEANQDVFEPGERALVTLRNVRATPPEGQHYAFYVQITSPIRTTLRADLFLQSDRFRQAQPIATSPVAMQPYQYGQENQYPDYYQPYQYQQPQPPAGRQPVMMRSFNSSSRQSYRPR